MEPRFSAAAAPLPVVGRHLRRAGHLHLLAHVICARHQLYRISCLLLLYFDLYVVLGWQPLLQLDRDLRLFLLTPDAPVSPAVSLIQ